MNTQSTATRKMGISMMVLAWGLLLVMVTLLFSQWLEQYNDPNKHATSHSNAKGQIEVTLRPNRQHHYLIHGLINGQPARFLLDTGATHVSIPEAAAEKLGLKKGRRYPVSTANGRVDVYRSHIERLSLGDIELHNIEASINPGMDGDMILLGMSALKEIEFAQKGELLILRQ